MLARISLTKIDLFAIVTCAAIVTRCQGLAKSHQRVLLAASLLIPDFEEIKGSTAVHLLLPDLIMVVSCQTLLLFSALQANKEP